MRIKLKLGKYIRSSFARRVSLVVAFVVNLIFLVILGINVYRSSKGILENKSIINLSNARAVANNVYWQASLVEGNLRLHDNAIHWAQGNEKSLVPVLKNIMQDNQINKCSLLLETPTLNDKEGGLGYYVTRKGDSLVFQKSNDNVYRIYPTYIIPKRLKKDYWSDPYYDDGDEVIAFSHVLHDEHGDFLGILKAEVSLGVFTESLIKEKVDTSSAAKLYVVGRNGYYLVHERDPRMVLNETYVTNARETNSPDVELMGREMLNHGYGTRYVMYNGKRNMDSFVNIDHLDWGVYIAVPFSEMLNDVNRTILFSLLLFVIGVCFMVYMIFKVIHKLTEPVTYFAEESRKIAMGNFDDPIQDLQSKDEIQKLGDALENMRVSLKKYIADLTTTTAAKESIEKELSIAHDIQMAMLPKIFPTPPKRKDVDLYGYLHSAKEVGGDLYDFFIKDDHLFFIIGDVSGKGIPASLIMAITNSLFRASQQMQLEPTAIVENINRIISDNNTRNMFVTMIVGDLDLKTGNLKFCNAGHDPMVLLHKNDEPRLIEMNRNIPVGLMEDFEYQKDEITIQPTDKLLLYTDGVSEAENTQKELYTIGRLLKVLPQTIGLSSRETLMIVENDIAKFTDGADQSDDITIMSIYYNPLMLMERKEIIFSNKMEEVPRIAAFIDEIGEELGLSFALVSSIQLAIEEAVVNVINYAYPDNVDGQNSLSVVIHEKILIFELCDYGTPFDPTSNKTPDLTLTAEDRPIGGLGIMLVKKIMNKVEYVRIDGQNKLSMTKIIG